MLRHSRVLEFWLFLGMLILSVACQGPLMAEPLSTSNWPVQWVGLPENPQKVPLFNSNSPEKITQPGIVLTTLPLKGAAAYHVEGAFGVFAHHVIERPLFSSGQMYMGLLIHNPNHQTTAFQINQALAYRTRPEAPFLSLPSQTQGKTSGPGSRVATEWILGQSNLPLLSTMIPPQQSQLVFQKSIPTNPLWLVSQTNALTLRMDAKSSRPVQISLVALVHEGLEPPKLTDYEAILKAEQWAGPQEVAVTEYEPQNPPEGGTFRYGRVSGVSQSTEWEADIPVSLRENQRLAIPISTVYLKRLGVSQNQSRPVLQRRPATAVQAHGNYGLTYRLKLNIEHPGTYELGFGHPVGINQASDLLFYPVPGSQVRFRGGVQIITAHQEKNTHIVLKEGEYLSRIQTFECGPEEDCFVEIVLNYPADATPPQVFTLHRTP